MTTETATEREKDAEIQYTVQQAAQCAGMSEHTLRYYERAGLLAPIARTGPGRHRRYSDSDLRRLEFIRRMRATGMPIQQLLHYMALLEEGDATALERQALLEAHRRRVCQQIGELERLLQVIDHKIANCQHLRLPPPARAASENNTREKEK